MTVCPIAIAVGCVRCPIYRVCPVKTIIGDAPKPGEPPPRAARPRKKAK